MSLPTVRLEQLQTFRIIFSEVLYYETNTKAAPGLNFSSAFNSRPLLKSLNPLHTKDTPNIWQFFSCHGLKWAPVSLKKLFSTKLIDFPKIRHKNVEYFDLLHANKPKFGLFLPLPVSNFFLALPFAFHILSGCGKKLGVD